VTDAEIQSLIRPVDAGGWAPDDAALLRFTDEALEKPDVSDQAWHAVAATLRDDQLLELIMLVGFYRMTAGFLNAVRVQWEGKLPGWPRAADSGV
jgi:4-carboxymuconolactone decarboxylase